VFAGFTCDIIRIIPIYFFLDLVNIAIWIVSFDTIILSIRCPNMAYASSIDNKLDSVGRNFYILSISLSLSVGIVYLRTKAAEFSFLAVYRAILVRI
jgi:hypothetical protein